MYSCFQGYIRFVFLLFPLICPHKVIHIYMRMYVCMHVDTCTVHTSYNLNETHVAHAEATGVTHACFCHINTITRTINYLHVRIRLHASSLPLLMLDFILYAHMCTGCDTRHRLLYFHRLVTARPI